MCVCVCVCAFFCPAERRGSDRATQHPKPPHKNKAFEGDSTATFFEGGYSEYEADRVARTGSALMPTRVKFRRLAAA